MKSHSNSLWLATCLAALALPTLTAHAEPLTARTGVLYTADNATGTNHVLVFPRGSNGALGAPTAVATGGAGTGGSLGNQGAVLLTSDGRWLLVCNAGSDSISVFAATAGGLELTDLVSSQGQQPISLTLHGDLLYVLNAGGEAGGTDSLAGFVFAYGHLFPLPGATSALSGTNTDPAEVSFTSDGEALVVTEKGTGLIDTFTVGYEGVATLAKTYSSPASPPYGFAAGDNNRIYVTQAAGGAGNPGASSVSSYDVLDNGSLTDISVSVPTHQTAACWLVLSRDEHFAYAANTPNDSVSSFRVRSNGSLQLLESTAALPGTGTLPSEMGVSVDNRFLYTLNGNGSINAYHINSFDGDLISASKISGLPTTINGLAVR